MKRFGWIVVSAAFAIVACGGNKDKPPLTPDQEPSMGAGDGGSEVPSSSDTSSTPGLPK